ncbi:MAG: hypothetical protein LBG06_08320 [Deltaproteobacteria bacterium]|nr:hypothetical protein [Deltaproteobacteria bacterium]
MAEGQAGLGTRGGQAGPDLVPCSLMRSMKSGRLSVPPGASARVISTASCTSSLGLLVPVRYRSICSPLVSLLRSAGPP